jgi:hypothetical protein
VETEVKRETCQPHRHARPCGEGGGFGDGSRAGPWMRRLGTQNTSVATQAAPFPGYEDIDISFEEIETLVRNSRLDWKAALESVKSIYW